jgi:hypothetical protein
MEIEMIGTNSELPNTSEYPPLVHFPPNNGATICCKFVNLLQFIIKKLVFAHFFTIKCNAIFFLKKINLIREILLNI